MCGPGYGGRFTLRPCGRVAATGGRGRHHGRVAIRVAARVAACVPAVWPGAGRVARVARVAV